MDHRIQTVLQFVQGHYCEGLTVTQSAGRVGLSRSRFEHLFKEETGVGFKQYLRQTRLLIAKELLLDWTLSIKQVATKVGYRWPADFSREFRNRFGISPSSYRRSTRTHPSR